MIGTKGQIRKIKDWLEAGKTITSMQAFKMFGCTRLAARILDLKRSGMQIDSILVENENGCRFAVYRKRG